MFLRNLVVAFSLYSRLPMPQFDWKEDDMKYNLAFLPLVGAVIGALEVLCFVLISKFGFTGILPIAMYSAVPLLVTGGFHIDGFMDTQDALKSYKEKEDKLKILKDPHIGAFAVISLLIFSVIWTGALSAFCDRMDIKTAIMFGSSFVLSRILTGISSLVLPKAKKDGMLNSETKSAGGGTLVALCLELTVFLIAISFVNWLYTAAFVAVLSIFFLYYRDKMHKEFGGVTGDTAGFFLVLSELIMAVTLALCSFIPA